MSVPGRGRAEDSEEELPSEQGQLVLNQQKLRLVVEVVLGQHEDGPRPWLADVRIVSHIRCQSQAWINSEGWQEVLPPANKSVHEGSPLWWRWGTSI